jgi:hypothetical protein
MKRQPYTYLDTSTLLQPPFTRACVELTPQHRCQTQAYAKFESTTKIARQINLYRSVNTTKTHHHQWEGRHDVHGTHAKTIEALTDSAYNYTSTPVGRYEMYAVESCFASGERARASTCVQCQNTDNKGTALGGGGSGLRMWQEEVHIYILSLPPPPSLSLTHTQSTPAALLGAHLGRLKASRQSSAP